MYWIAASILLLTAYQVRLLVICCSLPAVYGNGHERVRRYFWDSNTQQCIKFDYSGDGGNGNCFNTEGECMSRCGSGAHEYYGLGDGYHGETINTPINGYWSDWSAWGPCNQNGFTIKRRTCNVPQYGGLDCEGHKAVKKRCHPKVDGCWGSWSYWSSCSVSCGHGTSRRTRECNNPLPSYGGQSCDGSDTETMDCFTQNCGVDGCWGSWSEWSGCSATCGQGHMTKWRECNNPMPEYGGHDCDGDTVETADCNIKHCEVNGGWGSWGSWCDCSVTCGGGIMSRKRECNNPVQGYGGYGCQGDGVETHTCNEGYCMVDGGWGSWGSWCACSATCGDGYMSRKRICNNPEALYGGHVCNGNTEEVHLCNNGHCQVDGGWGSWGSWCACSATCGDGYMSRKRICNNPSPGYGGHDCNGNIEESASCNNGHCHVDGGWGSWGSWCACSVTCGDGYMSRKRVCNNPTPGYGGHDCNGNIEETHPCNEGHCGVDGGWGAWCEWSSCSASCGKGTTRRSRKCTNPTPSYGGHTCGSDSDQVMDCYVETCIPDLSCPGGGTPLLDSYGNILFCGGSESCQKCPYGYQCYPGSGSQRYCCPYSDDYVKDYDVCNMEPDSGNCQNSYSRYFYYNKHTDTCEYMAYGGCGGNLNRFDTLQECEKRCRNTKTTKDVCKLPCNTGDTSGSYCFFEYSEWYYDETSNQCKAFTYSGCGGNLNRFHDKVTCESVCTRQYDTSYSGDKCNLPKDAGYGKFHVKEFYYNKATDSCEALWFRGTGGNDNRFYDYYTCEAACKLNPIDPNVCYLEPDRGSGNEGFDQWYFDYTTQSCQKIIYGGSGGNQNRFHDEDSCVATCKDKSVTGSVCTLPKADGSGWDHLERYYYNKGTGACEQFYYKGQGGNENCFTSQKECDYTTQFCKKYTPPTQACYMPKDSGYSMGHTAPTTYWYFDWNKKQCNTFIHYGYGGNDNVFFTKEDCEHLCGSFKPSSDVCSLPFETGNCHQRITRYYFDNYLKTCREFTFTGCFENGNNFLTKSDCESLCGSFTPQLTVCDLQKDAGNGYYYQRLFYYNKVTKSCEIFDYTGQGGNGNRFGTYNDCFNTCVHTDYSDCESEFDRGTGDGYLIQYYYHKNLKECYRFAYKGTGGNNNRFPDKAACEKKCKA
ncbi:uncharacterized protein [Mytilus edulis]|uniref:uncharacterized protein isoform X2 n=1 Tax=Mytilus edulis TaxID=6550 RepID=UPI0039EE3A21